jgi:GNAT superfamily N-acetyltransferase
MIITIPFEEIYSIWNTQLWPNRQSAIETHSAMNFLGGYDIKNMISTPTFFAYKLDNKIVGVNSGHLCRDNSYRSRGLFVFTEYRKQGIGKILLCATIDKGKDECADYVWSYPKQSSWLTYTAAGFSIASLWEQSELDLNAYCYFKL